MTYEQLTDAVMDRYEELKRDAHLLVSPIEALECEIKDRIAEIRYRHEELGEATP